MLRLARSLGLIAVLTSAALACPDQPMVEEPVTPDGATLLGDGGVLMTTRAGKDDRGAMPSGPFYRSDGADVDVDAVYVAPALSLVRPKQVADRTIEIVDAKGTVLRSYAQRTGGTRLAAPTGRVTSTLTRAAAAKSVAPAPWQGTMTITLTQDPPADAAVIVMQLPRDKTGIAWAPVTPGARTFTFGPVGKGCTPGPAMVRSGDRVELVWFDVHGQRSATSAALTVGAPKR